MSSTGRAPNICERSRVWAPAFDQINRITPSRTRRVVSTSLMSILPSFASFRASMARWAPPSLEKRMKPCNRELHCQHNSVKNTPSFARIFSWQTQSHTWNFRLIDRLWLAQIWQLLRLSKLNVDSDQKVYYLWLFSGITLRQFWGHLIICDSRRWSYYAWAQYSIIFGQCIADHVSCCRPIKSKRKVWGDVLSTTCVSLCSFLMTLFWTRLSTTTSLGGKKPLHRRIL